MMRSNVWDDRRGKRRLSAIGGFLETGLIATAAQAGAAFGFQLIWSMLLGTVCLIFLVEMSGRFAIASHHTIADGIRERSR
jgi:Mn2+/Fe2+ NRAMP family transporter